MAGHVFFNGALCFLCALQLFFPAATAADGAIETLVARNEVAILVIEGIRADGSSVQGSGSVVHPDGLVLTTAHQVDGVDALTARQVDGVTFPLTVLEVDRERELALLRAPHPLPGAARVGDANTLRAGAALATIAAPDNLDASVATGIVASVNRTYRGFPVIQAELVAAPGSSGGPVFNSQGDLVGIIMGVLEEHQWATIVLPINNAYSLLERNGAYQTRLPDGTHDESLVPAADISLVELRALEAYNKGTHAEDVEAKKMYYQQAATMLPAFFEAWFNLGVAAHNFGDNALAVRAYEQALTVRPDSVEARRNLGRLYMEQGDYDAATPIFEAVVALLPDAPQTYNDLGEAYRNAGVGEKAIAMYKQALSLDASYANALYNLALAYMQEEAWEQAHNAFAQYLAAAPDAADRALVQDRMKAIAEHMQP